MGFLNNVKDNKKFFLIFLFLEVLLIAVFFKFEFNTSRLILVFVLIAVYLILFNKNEDYHKVAFSIILIFGILMAVTTPIFIVCDEGEHFTKSDLLVEGNELNVDSIFKFNSSSLSNQLYTHIGQKPVSMINEKINYTDYTYLSSFPQNPIYGYIFQSIGILIAMFLNLPAIYTLFFGRIGNLLLYAFVCSYAIKKTPKFKMAFLVISCLPPSIFQAASFSCDSFIISFTLLGIAYFIRMYYSSHIKNEDLLMFFVSLFLVGFFKFPYLLIAYLIFLIPKEKFQNEKIYYLSRFLPFIIFLIAMMYSYYVAPQLNSTVRSEYFQENNVNPSKQLSFILNHPINSILFYLQSYNLIPPMIQGLFCFSFAGYLYECIPLAYLIFIFLLIFSFCYPHGGSFTKKERIKIFIMLILISEMIIFIQHLSWAPYGFLDWGVVWRLGIHFRYFIPLLVFIPMMLSIKYIQIKDFDKYIYLCLIFFLASQLILTFSVYY